jgi:hypothetical protein
VTYGLVGLWIAGVLLIRVGYWPKLAQFAVARINAWVIAVLALGGAMQRFAGQDFVGGTINLIIGRARGAGRVAQLGGDLGAALADFGVRALIDLTRRSVLAVGVH